MKIQCLTAIWGRPRVTALFMQHFTLLQQYAHTRGVTLNLTVAGTNGSDLDLVPKSHKKVMVPNNPLGKKWNAGLKVCEDYDYLLILGSDDFINYSALDILIEKARAGYALTGFTDMWVYSCQKNEASYWKGYQGGNRHGHTIGAGRLIRADIVKAAGKLWKDNINRGLDKSMMDKLRPHLGGQKLKKINLLHTEGRIVDIKNGENLGGYEKYNHLKIDAKKFFDKHYPAGMYGQVLSLLK